MKSDYNQLSEPFQSEFISIKKRLRYDIPHGKVLDQAAADLFSVFYNAQTITRKPNKKR